MPQALNSASALTHLAEFPRLVRFDDERIAPPDRGPRILEIPFTEVEVRYTCRFSQLFNFIHRSPESTVGIHQSYIASWIVEKEIPLMVETVLGPEAAKELELFSKSRLRRMEYPYLGEEFFHEAKGLKDETGTPERALQITRERYVDLRSHAKDYLFKQRHSESAAIFLDVGNAKPIAIPIVIDIDEVLVAGRNVDDVDVNERPKSGLSVPIIEVEITRETRGDLAYFYPDLEINRGTIMSSINKGAHNFPLLDDLICLDRHPLEDALSMRKLARNGFDEVKLEIEDYFRDL